MVGLAESAAEAAHAGRIDLELVQLEVCLVAHGTTVDDLADTSHPTSDTIPSVLVPHPASLSAILTLSALVTLSSPSASASAPTAAHLRTTIVTAWEAHLASDQAGEGSRTDAEISANCVAAWATCAGALTDVSDPQEVVDRCDAAIPVCTNGVAQRSVNLPCCPWACVEQGTEHATNVPAGPGVATGLADNVRASTCHAGFSRHAIRGRPGVGSLDVGVPPSALVEPLFGLLLLLGIGWFGLRILAALRRVIVALRYVRVPWSTIAGREGWTFDRGGFSRPLELRGETPEGQGFRGTVQIGARGRRILFEAPGLPPSLQLRLEEDSEQGQLFERLRRQDDRVTGDAHFDTRIRILGQPALIHSLLDEPARSAILDLAKATLALGDAEWLIEDGKVSVRAPLALHSVDTHRAVIDAMLEAATLLRPGRTHADDRLEIIARRDPHAVVRLLATLHIDEGRDDAMRRLVAALMPDAGLPADAKTMAALIALLGCRNSPVAVAACHALIEHGDTTALTALTALTDDDADWKTAQLRAAAEQASQLLRVRLFGDEGGGRLALAAPDQGGRVSIAKDAPGSGALSSVEDES